MKKEKMDKNTFEEEYLKGHLKYTDEEIEELKYKKNKSHNLVNKYKFPSIYELEKVIYLMNKDLYKSNNYLKFLRIVILIFIFIAGSMTAIFLL